MDLLITLVILGVGLMLFGLGVAMRGK